MERIKIGMVGSQFAAHLHLNSLSKLRGSKVEVVAVVSRNRANAENFARKFNIPDAYDDYRHKIGRAHV